MPSHEINTPSQNTLSLRSKFAGRLGLTAFGRRPEQAHLSDIRPFIVGAEAAPYGDVSVNSPEGQDLAARLQASPRLGQSQWVPSAYFVGAKKIARFGFSEGDVVNLPVANFVNAPGLYGWEGRGSVKTVPGRGQMQSSAVIKQYARRRTPMPDIQGVAAYVQPNGTVLFAGLQDGAHRLAAAQLRGDETIGVSEGLSVYALEHDIAPASHQYTQ